MAKNKNKLTPKQERFCREYVVDLNGTQAAIRAGYSPNGAEVTASKLLIIAKVRQRVDELNEKKFKRSDITADRVLAELARIAFAKMGDVAYWNESGVTFKASSELTDEQMASVSEVSEQTNQHGGSLKVKQHDKAKALELLGRHLKLFTDKTEHSGGVTLEQLLTGNKTNKGEK